MSVFEVVLVRIFPAFSRIRTEYGEILVSQENAGKMRTRITPNTDTFYAVRVLNILLQSRDNKWQSLSELILRVCFVILVNTLLNNFPITKLETRTNFQELKREI